MNIILVISVLMLLIIFIWLVGIFNENFLRVNCLVLGMIVVLDELFLSSVVEFVFWLEFFDIVFEMVVLRKYRGK